VWTVLWLIWTHNDLVDLRNRMLRARSNIDVQLRRRRDLIAQFVGAVRGQRDYEASVQRVIAEIRAQGSLVDVAAANGRAVPVTPQLRVLAEALPNLQSSGSFMALQKALSECERRIALARDEFNGTTAGFNTRVTTVPTSFVASLFRMRVGEFFSADQFERTAPKISPPARSR
jgi:LemA protein